MIQAGCPSGRKLNQIRKARPSSCTCRNRPRPGLSASNQAPLQETKGDTVAGVASQPNVFYAGFDNGGVWRSTDYGANWVPIFDDQPTGSIGAIGEPSTLMSTGPEYTPAMTSESSSSSSWSSSPG